MRQGKVEDEIDKEYEVLERIGTGAFGFIVSVRGREDGRIYACKIEKNHGKKIILVQKEFEIMLQLMRTNHFPEVYTLQKLPENSYIIMQKLDFNLEDLFLKCKKQFSLQTLALIIDQTVQTLSVMHDHGYLHRDLKPQNFMVKMGSHHIKLIDFGLSDNLTVRKANTLIGNVRFCSREAHFGNSSKKEDLESLMFLLYYFMVGSVPWQSASKEQIELEINRKADVSSNIDTPILQAKYHFLQSLNFPNTHNLIKTTFYQQFALIIKYAFELRSQVEPNYAWLQSRCKRLLLLSGTRRDSCFQWCPPNCPLARKEQLWDVFSAQS